MTDIDESDAGFTLTGGVMRVHALGSESGDAAMVDDPDVALRALGVFDTAIGAAGGHITGDVSLLQPGGGLRLLRGGLDSAPDGGATGTGAGG